MGQGSYLSVRNVRPSKHNLFSINCRQQSGLQAHFHTLEATTKITPIYFSNNQSTFSFYLDTKNYYKRNKWPLGKASLPFQSFALKSDNRLCFNVKCYENKDIYIAKRKSFTVAFCEY